MMPTTSVATLRRAQRTAGGLALAVCSFAALSPSAQAQTTLADAPIFSSMSVPGNLALALSVEFPTAISVAYTNRTYSSANTYLGYFDPNKCYTYSYTDGTSVNNYFAPAGATTTSTSHMCTGQWSGNFLNWASMQTIDPFRWVLTGGYRVIDTSTVTVVEKAWGSVQGSAGGNFPNSIVSGSGAGAVIAGATPFPSSTTSFSMSVWGLGNQMRFAVPNTSGTTPALTGTPTSYNGTATGKGVVYQAFVRAKVCDPSVVDSSGRPLLESNCTAYGSNYKPEGLIQQYSNKIRFSAFGYLNDGNILRDGGVLRAQQKFVGPTLPVPGSAAVANAPGVPLGQTATLQTTGAEWSASTGVFTLNPDATDAANTAGIMGLPSGSIANSGVINYLNKFGATAQSYKTYDNVSELYYAALRYFKNLQNVPEWTAVPSGTSQATITTWTDGFPVITAPPDPILYSCQRNFILGIGDVHTHADKNVPHPGTSLSANEPSMPSRVAADTSVNAVTRTNQVGVMEGLGSSIGTTNPWGSCCNNNSALIAGLAYDAHITDIRGRTIVAPAKPQTVDTYWVDVWEGGSYEANNQFYLATKYGGFTVPDGYTAGTALTLASWHTNTDTNGTQPRPDNYFSGGQPAAMQAGLTAAFADIAARVTQFTTSFATPLPQVALSGNASYGSLYDASNWTGEVIASDLSFNTTTGDPVLTQKWKFTDRLATQLAGTGGWSTTGNRRVVTWNGTNGVQFCSGTTGCTLPITSTQFDALDPSYTTAVDKADYLNYLRGDRTNEQGTTGGTRTYRTRAALLGDIVGSKAGVVGPPNLPLSDGPNPGYGAFKETWKARPTVVYVGSNDGMMHAIHGDVTGATTPVAGGTELFAYVPSALFQGPNATRNLDGLASLGNPSFQHHFMVNATPSVYDVDMSRTVGGSGAPDWRSVLIGGLGKGGRSYYAIDVTDPVGMANPASGGSEVKVAGKVLWEFTDPDLGYTYGDPIVAKTLKFGWVVILPSGYNNADGKGYLFMINPRTGALLQKVSTGVGSPSNSAGLAHANGYVTDYSDGTIDAVYAGDLLGNIWRWDVTDPSAAYPAPIKLASLTDSTSTAKPQPITARPLIEIHPNLNKRFVLVGTGRLLDSSDISSTQPQTFYAITDGSGSHFNAAADLPSGITFPITRAVLAANTNALVGVTYDPATQMGWYEELGLSGAIGWRVTTDATSVLNQVAWTASLPNGDACNPSGSSRVYARDFGTSASTIGTRVGTAFTPELYKSLAGMVTDLRYLSVNGKSTLISGTDSGGVQKLDTEQPTTPGLRRLNWRELQTVE